MKTQLSLILTAFLVTFTFAPTLLLKTIRDGVYLKAQKFASVKEE